MFVLNPFKLNKSLHNEIVNNKSTLFLTLINNWKKPNHLVLIIGEDVILYNDITQIILWCMIAGVSFVSIYDYKNRLSQLQLMSAIKCNPMFEEINKLTFGFSFNSVVSKSKLGESMVLDSSKVSKKSEFNGIHKYYADDMGRILTIIEDCKIKENNLKYKQSFKEGINGTTGLDINQNGNGCCNGNRIKQNDFDKWFSQMLSTSENSSCNTKLNILSRQQCETDLLTSIKELSESKIDVNSVSLQEKLHEKCPLPDPEVAIVIGNKLCSYGMLPWNIRLTEFFQFNNYYDISISKFNSILKKFSKCEQRYGK